MTINDSFNIQDMVLYTLTCSAHGKELEEPCGIINAWKINAQTASRLAHNITTHFIALYAVSKARLPSGPIPAETQQQSEPLQTDW